MFILNDIKHKIILHASSNIGPGRRISSISLMEQHLFLIHYLKILQTFIFIFLFFFPHHPSTKIFIGFHQSRCLQLQVNTGCVFRYSTQAALGVLVPCRIPWQKSTHRMAQRHRNWKTLSKLTPRNRLTTPPKETAK